MRKKLLLLFILALPAYNLLAQCTEAKDAEMAKYKRLTQTQDAQGCSQCAMLAMYFCSAKYCVKKDDIDKVGKMIEACKQNIRNMGQPYCCPEYLDKKPQWGIGVNGGSSQQTTTEPQPVSETETADYKALADKYRQMMKDDPKNATTWAFCSAAALARERMSPQDFANYAKRVVASLKQNPANKTNPCPDVLGEYWDGGGAPTRMAKAAPKTTSPAQAASAAMASAGPVINANSNAPKINDEKSGFKREVSVDVDRVPGFVSGQSMIVPGEVRGSYRGLYVLYYPDAGTSGRGLARVYKKHGRDWMRSEQEALITSYWISSHPDNEGAAALNYHWTGPPALKQSIGQVMAQNRGTVSGTANLGSYNSPGNSFANDNPPTLFLKITGDKARYNLWGFGNAPDGDVNTLGNAHLYRVNDEYARPEGQRFDMMDVSAFLELDDVIMEGSVRKGDNHIWIAQGNNLFKAQPDGNVPFLFKTLKFPAAVSKVRVTEEWVWVLAGNGLYRIGRDDVPNKFYTINSGDPSFAVDQNNVYTNDGYILWYAHYTRKPLLGDGPSTFTKAEWAALKSELGGLELEVAPGEHLLYLINRDNGKVYTIKTY